MNKAVQKVRQSIAKRNNMRRVIKSNQGRQQIIPPLPQEEEKHGYYAVFQENQQPETSAEQFSFVGQFFLKGVLAAILFFVVAILLQTNIPLLEKPKQWTSHAIQEEFPFASIHQWYQEAFGSPLAFSLKTNDYVGDAEIDSLPVMGSVSQSFQSHGSGIMIDPEEFSSVSAWRDGIIVFAGNDRETNKTVVIQHADRSKTTYGFLSSIDVHLYQYVAKHQEIGTFDPNHDHRSVFFSIEKDQTYIDPIQVITVDDLP